MMALSNSQPHVVCIPFPAQGHVNPFMQLSKLLHARGFYITFVNTEFNRNRLLRSKGPEAIRDMPGFRFETIPDGVPPSNPNATQSVTELLYYTKKHSVAPLRELLTRLNSEEDRPRITCVISDGIMCFSIKVARELGIPEVQFWTASACGLLAYLQFGELVERGIFPLKDESYLRNGYMNKPLDWIPGMGHMRMKDMPSFVRSANPEDIAFNRWLEEARDNLTSDALLFNSFSEFESEVLSSISSLFPNIFSIGPLNLLCKKLPISEAVSRSSSLWKEDTDCLTWLDSHLPDSVIYVNFGSIAVMSKENFDEFAWGLASSGHPFLWIVRSDAVMGKSAVFPAGFLEEVIEKEKKGMIIGWCPQDKVLAHPSIGAFLTHSGWNSTLEGICGGVPMMCWPFFAEQQVNCRYAATTWGVGVEIKEDVKREEVEGLIKEMMGGKSGRRMREKALEWRKKAEAAADEGGSSYNDFERLVRFLKKMV